MCSKVVFITVQLTLVVIDILHKWFFEIILSATIFSWFLIWFGIAIYILTPVCLVPLLAGDVLLKVGHYM